MPWWESENATMAWRKEAACSTLALAIAAAAPVLTEMARMPKRH